MVQPHSFEQMSHSDVPLVCKLQKALYGLKRAHRAWFEKLNCFLLTNLQFQALLGDNCLFMKPSDLGSTFFLAYVDDIVVTDPPTLAISAVIQSINQEFQLKKKKSRISAQKLGQSELFSGYKSLGY